MPHPCGIIRFWGAIKTTRTEAELKITRTNLFLFAGAFASLSSFAFAQTASQRAPTVKPKVTVSVPVGVKVVTPARAMPVSAPPGAMPVSVPPRTMPVLVPGTTTPLPAAALTVTAPPIIAPLTASLPAQISAPVGPITPPPVAATLVVVTDEAARAAFRAGLNANSAGNLRDAEAGFRQAIVLAPAGEGGDVISMDAAKRLGFLAFENRNPRAAETFFGAEAVLARRLYFSGKISPRGFADAVGRFASATGAMGRSGDSAALVFYAQEIKSRAQAEASAQVLNRDANNAADAVSGVRVATSGLCVVGRDPILKDRVSCDDESGARSEALSMQARQIRASAPPPPTKEEREAKAAKAKAKGGG